MVLNSFEWGIKHTVCLTVPCFLIEDAPFKDDVFGPPVATISSEGQGYEGKGKGKSFLPFKNPYPQEGF